jgi:hypothetical protein
VTAEVGTERDIASPTEYTIDRCPGAAKRVEAKGNNMLDISRASDASWKVHRNTFPL